MKMQEYFELERQFKRVKDYMDNKDSEIENKRIIIRKQIEVIKENNEEISELKEMNRELLTDFHEMIKDHKFEVNKLKERIKELETYPSVFIPSFWITPINSDDWIITTTLDNNDSICNTKNKTTC